MADLIALKNKFSKFSRFDFRPYQEDVIRFVENSDKPICVIQAPTGFGKSLASVCAGALYDKFTYLVSSKQLQSQLNHDFPELAMMKGRNNFDCLRNPGNSADECTHNKKNPCPYKKSDCPYEITKSRVLASDYRLLNYHYFLFEANHIGRFSGHPLTICDEGDMLEGLLAGFISLTIPGSLVDRMNVDPPKYKTTTSEQSIPEWKRWAEDLLINCNSDLHDVEASLEDADPRSDDLRKMNKLKRRLSSAVFQLKVFLQNVDETWIFEQKEPYKLYGASPTYIFKPTWITEKLSQQFFFRHGEKFLITSATFPPHTVLGKLLGRPPGDFDYMTVPSSFPVENRPVKLRCVANLTAKTFDAEVGMVLDEIVQILASHALQKGIIHAVSYKLTQKIMDLGLPRLITHNNKDREEVIGQFKDSGENLVLVSPSIERGVDLPDDMCRFIIMAKAPFLSLGDKLTSRRAYSGPVGSLWYRSLCAQAIVQSCGRGVRHKDDRCDVYILDSQIKKMILEERKLFPNYWIEAVEL